MRLLIAAFLLAGLPAAVPAQPAARADAARTAIVAEAQAFMTAYARDLSAGNRAALAARYSTSGAHLLGFGPARLVSHAQLTDRYAREWQKPVRFAWHGLSYEPVGGDAVLVVGGFDWDDGDGKGALPYAYTGLLKRERGVLRIRLEHENALPVPAAK